MRKNKRDWNNENIQKGFESYNHPFGKCRDSQAKIEEEAEEGNEGGVLSDPDSVPDHLSFQHFQDWSIIWG